MSKNRDVQFRTETPFLPQPVAGDVLEAVVRPAMTVAEAEAQLVRLSDLRQQVAAAVDTVDLAISNNHADYVGGRHSWSYETSNEVKLRLRILKRQRQHLQEAFGTCKRRLKDLQHDLRQSQATADKEPHMRAVRFVQMAQALLDPQTITMLWELVDSQEASNGVGGRAWGEGADAP